MRQLFVAAGLSLLIASCGSRAGEPKQKTIPNGDIPVRVAAIQKDLQTGTIETSGSLSTEDEARLSFKVGGIIDRIYVREGEQIRKGQLLATLKSTEISAQVQQVQLSVEKAQRDYERVLNLYRDSVATLEQLQNAKTGLEIARQGLRAAGFNQQYARIYAMADGFVVKQLKHEGELAEPGAPLLLTRLVGGGSGWILTVGLSDQDWAQVSLGDSVAIRFDAYPGKSFSGMVHRKALAADPASGVFGVEVRVQMGSDQPAVGIFGKASIRTSKRVDGYIIPYDALLEANGKQGFVFVTNDGKTVKRVPVTIASIGKEHVQIAGGLEGYQQVVVSGSPYLSDKTTIRIIP